ncbi:hypothetical protein HMPREF1547_00839 [Blautia sp. KLE 1732]|nr:hypothetical protein HMPREF1547_00839 [Blautia sp. KLE 1732]
MYHIFRPCATGYKNYKVCLNFLYKFSISFRLTTYFKHIFSI